MNKEKEFEEKILNKLLVDLKDIDKYKSFKNGSFIYDLGYYQGNLLVNEIDRLNNITSKLEKWLKENAEKDTYSSIIFGVVLNYFQELKDSDNNVKKINTNNN